MLKKLLALFQPRQKPLDSRSYIAIGIATLTYSFFLIFAYQNVGVQSAMIGYVFLAGMSWIYGLRVGAVSFIYAVLITGIVFKDSSLSQVAIGFTLYLGCAVGVGLISGLYKKLQITESLLRLEHEKSEQILNNIFPKKIVERLKKGELVIADKYWETSILFSDLVGFTCLTRTMQPHDLVMLLDRLITGFDKLSEQFGVEKIKTIGDAYLVVSGMPEENSNHADQIIKMAQEMIVYVEEFNRIEHTNLQIRIGVHSGAVIGGVIGPKKYSFDLWGDTVNLASRLESTGIPGRVQVSQTTYELVKDLYEFEARDAFDIKGFGYTKTYFLKN